MWIFSRYGFYSIACGTTPDGALDSENVMVRARSGITSAAFRNDFLISPARK